MNATKAPQDPWLHLVQRTQAAFDLGTVAKTDFEEAVLAVAHMDCGYARRNVIRCFGSLIDALTAIFRDGSQAVAEALNRPRNEFLDEKCRGRGTTVSYRVRACFKLVAEVFPGSPFDQAEPERWDRLHAALEVRNRILHPDADSGLSVSNVELKLIDAVAAEYLADLELLKTLCGMVLEQLFHATSHHRNRVFAKIRFSPSAQNGEGKAPDLRPGIPFAA